MAERCIRTTERERLSSTACERRLYTATLPLLCYVVERENPKAYTLSTAACAIAWGPQLRHLPKHTTVLRIEQIGTSGCSWPLLAHPGCSWRLLAAPGCAPGCSWLLLAAHVNTLESFFAGLRLTCIFGDYHVLYTQTFGCSSRPGGCWRFLPPASC